MPTSATPWILVLLAGLAAAGSAVLIVFLRPLLKRYATAAPNLRSSHRQPTPQGGGIAVIVSTVAVITIAAFVAPDILSDYRQIVVVLAAIGGLSIVGITDDIRPLEALPRLVLQTLAVALVIWALPSNLRIIPPLPFWFERLCLLIGGIWFVNLVNFMDGIDWMTVVEVVPLSATLVIFGSIGALPPDGLIVSLVLCGAMIGFAPFNRPVARLFLGDVGSLPIGLLLGWLLILLAGRGHLVSALLMPLYYLADTTITLIQRQLRGEQITQAHRSHFYQRALDRGFSVSAIVTRVFAANIVLCALAIAAALAESLFVRLGYLGAGIIVVAFLLVNLKSGPRQKSMF